VGAGALSAGSDKGAEHWAMLASLIETCKLHSVNPEASLTDVLTRLVNGWPNHFRIPAAFGLIFVLGYTAVACLACNAVLKSLRRRVTWKGRTYRLVDTSTAGP